MRAARREWLVLAGPSQGGRKARHGPPVTRERQGDYTTDLRFWLIPRPPA